MHDIWGQDGLPTSDPGVTDYLYRKSNILLSGTYLSVYQRCSYVNVNIPLYCRKKKIRNRLHKLVGKKEKILTKK